MHNSGDKWNPKVRIPILVRNTVSSRRKHQITLKHVPTTNSSWGVGYRMVYCHAPKRTSTELTFCSAPIICLRRGINSTLGRSWTNRKAGSMRWSACVTRHSPRQGCDRIAGSAVGIRSFAADCFQWLGRWRDVQIDQSQTIFNINEWPFRLWEKRCTEFSTTPTKPIRADSVNHQSHQWKMARDAS